MATLNITNRYLNRDKRYAEAVVVTLPSQLEEGGVRLSTPPVYAQQDDSYTATVVERESIVKKCYLIIDEAFPASTVLAVSVGVTAFHADIDATAEGLTASATEDLLVTAGATVTITPSGGTAGDITTGKARVVLDVVSTELNNGNYSVVAS